ncbi:hypothetical protein QZH41_005087 [Actinostola sp. cb2023]|nr:hypothetical protein QZH41_005087 [Actinostola sp. cb2023]
MKTSANNNLYFDLQLQTQQDSFRAVCYSPDKHKNFKAKAETSLPIKIMNYQKRKNKWNSEDEIHITKRTRLADPLENESNFDLKDQNAKFEDKMFSDVATTTGTKVPQLINIQGRITFQGSIETLMSKGKTLRKQEAFLTDGTGTIRLVLWEHDIEKIITGDSYQLMKVRVRLYNATYITLNKQSLILPTHLTIDKPDDDDLKAQHQLKTVNLPAEGVQGVTRYLSCNSCRSKIAEEQEKKVVKCAQCGLSQLKNKCSTRLFTKAIFAGEGDSISLVLFDDMLKTLFEFNRHDNIQSFEELDENAIEELLLEAEATVVYNSKNNIVAIKRKQE